MAQRDLSWVKPEIERIRKLIFDQPDPLIIADDLVLMFHRYVSESQENYRLQTENLELYKLIKIKNTEMDFLKAKLSDTEYIRQSTDILGSLRKLDIPTIKEKIDITFRSIRSIAKDIETSREEMRKMNVKHTELMVRNRELETRVETLTDLNKKLVELSQLFRPRNNIGKSDRFTQTMSVSSEPVKCKTAESSTSTDDLFLFERSGPIIPVWFNAPGSKTVYNLTNAARSQREFCQWFIHTCGQQNVPFSFDMIFAVREIVTNYGLQFDEKMVMAALWNYMIFYESVDGSIIKLLLSDKRYVGDDVLQKTIERLNNGYPSNEMRDLVEASIRMR